MKGLNFQPKLFSTLKNYSRANLITDIMAGIIVGIVALPLAIAFGIASGVTPEKGIITAIVAGFIISFLGGSKVQLAVDGVLSLLSLRYHSAIRTGRIDDCNLNG